MPNEAEDSFERDERSAVSDPFRTISKMCLSNAGAVVDTDEIAADVAVE